MYAPCYLLDLLYNLLLLQGDIVYVLSPWQLTVTQAVDTGDDNRKALFIIFVCRGRGGEYS